jgi:hypothetical protein
MKTGKYLSIVLAILFITIITACSTQANPTNSAVFTDSATIAATESPASIATDSPASVSDECAGVPTPSQDMDALIRSKLLDHHSIDRVYSAQHTREEWSATLDRMIGYGAQISENEKQQIIDYLVCFHP